MKTARAGLIESVVTEIVSYNFRVFKHQGGYEVNEDWAGLTVLPYRPEELITTCEVIEGACKRSEAWAAYYYNADDTAFKRLNSEIWREVGRRYNERVTIYQNYLYAKAALARMGVTAHSGA